LKHKKATKELAISKVRETGNKKSFNLTINSMNNLYASGKLLNQQILFGKTEIRPLDNKL
jgi:hypothetical protein